MFLSSIYLRKQLTNHLPSLTPLSPENSTMFPPHSPQSFSPQLYQKHFSWSKPQILGASHIPASLSEINISGFGLIFIVLVLFLYSVLRKWNDSFDSSFIGLQQFIKYRRIIGKQQPSMRQDNKLLKYPVTCEEKAQLNL